MKCNRRLKSIETVTWFIWALYRLFRRFENEGTYSNQPKNCLQLSHYSIGLKGKNLSLFLFRRSRLYVVFLQSISSYFLSWCQNRQLVYALRWKTVGKKCVLFLKVTVEDSIKYNLNLDKKSAFLAWPNVRSIERFISFFDRKKTICFYC